MAYEMKIYNMNLNEHIEVGRKKCIFRLNFIAALVFILLNTKRRIDGFKYKNIV